MEKPKCTICGKYGKAQKDKKKKTTCTSTQTQFAKQTTFEFVFNF